MDIQLPAECTVVQHCHSIQKVVAKLRKPPYNLGKSRADQETACKLKHRSGYDPSQISRFLLFFGQLWSARTPAARGLPSRFLTVEPGPNFGIEPTRLYREFPADAGSTGCLSLGGHRKMNPPQVLEDAIHHLRELALIPQESWLESKLELVVGDRAGETALQACKDQSNLTVKDVRGLSSVYSLFTEPLSVILCFHRDLACFFDVLNGELIMEATTAGQERVVVVAGDDFSGFGAIGQQENARVAFAGLAPKKTYMVGLVSLSSSDSLFEEAERMDESGESKLEALTLIERALSLNPCLQRAWRRKAYILRELGRRDEALSAADKSVQIDPNYALGWRCKGAILRDLGQHQPGLDCYLRSLAIDPTDPVCWANKGNALSALGRQEEAREAYAEGERIGELYPEKR
jgi:tetratricopeptide (TPR) repeat protein